MHILIKPASGNCNMRCNYCFYADETKHRSISDCGIMADHVLQKIIKKVLEAASEECSLTFQGGEPTLAGIRYYEKAVAYVEQYNVNHCRIHYGIQTNGYSLNEQWCLFFTKHHFLVGISLDGYQELHDKYRKDAAGNGTFARVMHSIELLKKYQIPYNILTVVHRETAEEVNKVYNFFHRSGFQYQQYIECLDPLDGARGQQNYSLTPDLYLMFLKGMFRKWYRDMMQGHYVYNRYFENLLLMLQGKEPESCNMRGYCSMQLVVEADGSAYPCDFYALDEWKLGNLADDSIRIIDRKRKELGFIQQSKAIPHECQKCKWYFMCRNGCRRNCELLTKQNRGKNYYCKAYYEFFEYAYKGFLEILYKWT